MRVDEDLGRVEVDDSKQPSLQLPLALFHSGILQLPCRIERRHVASLGSLNSLLSTLERLLQLFHHFLEPFRSFDGGPSA